jgi:hypothetical protein
MDFIKLQWIFQNFFLIKHGLQGSLARQDMQKTVLKRQGSLAKTRSAEKCLARTRPAEKCLEETRQTCKLLLYY